MVRTMANITDSWVRRAVILLISGVGVLGGCSSLTDVDGLTTAPTAPQNSTVEAESSSSGITLPSLPFGQSITALSRIKEQPEAGKTYAIEGTVQRRVAILNGWLYQIQDETGHLWIMTQTSTPTVGDSARVTGILQYEQILIGETDIGEYYLQENSYNVIE